MGELKKNYHNSVLSYHYAPPSSPSKAPMFFVALISFFIRIRPFVHSLVVCRWSCDRQQIIISINESLKRKEGSKQGRGGG